MSMRVVALLIPLAITMPQLQKNSPPAEAPQLQIVQAPMASRAEWSWDTRCMADAASTRVELEPPELVAVHKASAPQAAPKPARHASSAKAATTAKASMRPAPRHAKRAPLQPDCQPFVHCAPVVVGKVTPVNPRSM